MIAWVRGSQHSWGGTVCKIKKIGVTQYPAVFTGKKNGEKEKKVVRPFQRNDS